MEIYYTEKERHIHAFLLKKGWTDIEISKVMFDITKWVTVMEMPIETYYKLIMKEMSYTEYKEYIANIDPAGFLFFKRIRRKVNFTIIVALAFIILLILTWIKGG